MDMPAPRRFSLLDGMILIGSAAVGLAAIRGIDPSPENLLEFSKALVLKFAWDWNYFDQASEGIFLAMPLAVSTSMGVLAMRLRKPRPAWRRLTRQPGVVAGLALVLSWVAAMGFTIVSVLANSAPMLVPPGTVPPSQSPFLYLQTFTMAASMLGGFAVVVAWTTQIVVGRWRAEPTWLDRLGRVVGLAWIVLGFWGCAVFRSITP